MRKKLYFCLIFLLCFINTVGILSYCKLKNIINLKNYQISQLKDKFHEAYKTNISYHDLINFPEKYKSQRVSFNCQIIDIIIWSPPAIDPTRAELILTVGTDEEKKINANVTINSTKNYGFSYYSYTDMNLDLEKGQFITIYGTFENIATGIGGVENSPLISIDEVEIIQKANIIYGELKAPIKDYKLRSYEELRTCSELTKFKFDCKVTHSQIRTPTGFYPNIMLDMTLAVNYDKNKLIGCSLELEPDIDDSYFFVSEGQHITIYGEYNYSGNINNDIYVHKIEITN